jgi:hypothetical protein
VHEILGSGLLERWALQPIFLAMTAAGVALLVAGFTVPESVDQQRPAMDPWGTVTVVAAVGLIVVGAIEAPVRGWLDPLVIGSFVGGVAAAVTGVSRGRGQRRRPQAKPMADFAKAAFIHGAQQASLALGFMTVIAAVLVAAWAPGRPDTSTRESSESRTEQQPTSP